MYVYLCFEDKLERGIGKQMETNSDFHSDSGHPGGEHTDQYDGNNRDIIKSSEHANQLPQPIRGELQQGRYAHRYEGNGEAAPLGTIDQRPLIELFVSQWLEHIKGKHGGGAIDQ